MPRMMEITFLNSGFQFFSEGECPLTPSSLRAHNLLRHYTPTIPTTMLVENLFKALNYASLEKYTKDSR